jgi:transketolase
MDNNQVKISMRDTFWNKIYEIAKNDPDVIVVSADMGAPSLDKFRKNLSSQFVNTGIAEQNTVVVSSGLALEGKKVFAYAIAPFITLRCYEQTKVELAGMNIPVTLVGVGAGFSYEDSGPTHHTVEDISIMRILPNMTVYCPSDVTQAEFFAQVCCEAKSPNYVRLDREVLPAIYEKGTDFSEGLKVLKEGDFYIIATGNMVHRALEVSDILAKESIKAGVIDLFRLPINQVAFLQSTNQAKKILTLEEHTLPGGLGSAVLEVLADNNRMIPVKRLGLDCSKGYCYKYGGRRAIQSRYALDAENIAKTVKDFINQ